ncbi:MAG TPA: PfkB family carbohydrate kinase [Solirubrobacteraceae bacterium]|nr:PfkB family carbohydrate kinase [Solirubrobacteraceae bacterium]
MSATTANTPPTLCLGEALVDLIGEEWVGAMRELHRFRPHFGGTMANVAVVAARAGAPIALVGGVGDDEWGRWLADRLRAEGVDISGFALLAGVNTQLAFVAIDRAGEPRYELYGEPVESLVHAAGDRIGAAIGSASGLLISSNTLAGEQERAVTMRARELALARQCPVAFDCNLRLHRWPSPAEAAKSANACVPGALLVRANQAEAELMTGESDPERAALAMCEAGAQLVVITLGSGGAILRGAGRADVGSRPADVRSTVGAGDVFTGVLLARLALSGFDVSAAAPAMEEAAAAAARACEHWGALD